MPWFSAHAILYARFKAGAQSEYPVWENVYLIEAPSSEAALAAANERARNDEGDSSGTFTWNGKPAEWVFAGIRKLISVSHAGVETQPRHGDELTYSEHVVGTLDAVRQLAQGHAVDIRYDE